MCRGKTRFAPSVEQQGEAIERGVTCRESTRRTRVLSAPPPVNEVSLMPHKIFLARGRESLVHAK